MSSKFQMKGMHAYKLIQFSSCDDIQFSYFIKGDASINLEFPITI